MLLGNLAAQAATLDGVQGEVMVNRGNGYELATNGMELQPGDVVVVNPGGAAQLTYGSGCAVPLQVGAVVPVSTTAPCSPLTTGATETPAPLNAMTFTIGAVVVGGGIAALVALNGNDKDRPASP